MLGYDGRVLPSAEVRRLSQALDGVILHRELDLVGDIWANRPARSCRKAWELDEAHAGRSRTDKLAQIRAEMAEQEADCLVLPALDDIAWLLNLRGDDVACNPVVLAFAAVEPERVLLFAQPAAFDEALQKRLLAVSAYVFDFNVVHKNISPYRVYSRERVASKCASPSASPLNIQNGT